MRILLPVLVAVALSLSACGGSTDMSADIAKSLPETAVNAGDSLTDVSCVKRTETVYRCVGQYKTSEDNAVAGYAKHNGLTADEAGQMDDSLKSMIVAQGSGPVSYDVTVKQDGSYIAEPQQ